MIKINDKYIIRSTPECYVAEYKRSNRMKVDKKTGEEVPDIVLIGYYGKLSGAFRACKDDAVKRRLGEKEYTLQEAIKEIAEITKEFEQQLSVLDGKEEHI